MQYFSSNIINNLVLINIYGHVTDWNWTSIPELCHGERPLYQTETDHEYVGLKKIMLNYQTLANI